MTKSRIIYIALLAALVTAIIGIDLYRINERQEAVRIISQRAADALTKQSDNYWKRAIAAADSRKTFNPDMQKVNGGYIPKFRPTPRYAPPSKLDELTDQVDELETKIDELQESIDN